MVHFWCQLSTNASGYQHFMQNAEAKMSFSRTFDVYLQNESDVRNKQG